MATKKARVSTQGSLTPPVVKNKGHHRPRDPGAGGHRESFHPKRRRRCAWGTRQQNGLVKPIVGHSPSSAWLVRGQSQHSACTRLPPVTILSRCSTTPSHRGTAVDSGPLVGIIGVMGDRLPIRRSHPGHMRPARANRRVDSDRSACAESEHTQFSSLRNTYGI